jgi:hypothetical protein
MGKALQIFFYRWSFHGGFAHKVSRIANCMIEITIEDRVHASILILHDINVPCTACTAHRCHEVLQSGICSPLLDVAIFKAVDGKGG